LKKNILPSKTLFIIGMANFSHHFCQNGKTTHKATKNTFFLNNEIYIFFPFLANFLLSFEIFFILLLYYYFNSHNYF